MSAEQYAAVLVFGPDAAEAAEAHRGMGVRNLIECADLDTLELPEATGANLTLAFAHRVPPKWAGQDPLDPWFQELLDGTLMGGEQMGHPEVRGLGNAQDNRALLLLHWDAGDTATFRAVAEALEESYADIWSGWAPNLR